MTVRPTGDVLVVLAGGRSSRFGQDKALAPFGPDAEPMAVRTLRRLSLLAPRRVLVRAAPFAALPPGVVQIADPQPGGGPLQALAAVFEQLPARRWLVAPCDLPGLSPSIYERLAEALAIAPLDGIAQDGAAQDGAAQDGAAQGGAALAVARSSRGLEPLVSIWTPAAVRPLASWLASEPGLAVHHVFARLPTTVVDFDDASPFVNVNTPADLAECVASERVAAECIASSSAEAG